jgi:hypothetical protein
MFNSQGTMQIAFSSGKSWLFFLLVGGISFISEMAILAFKTLFYNNVRNCIKLMKNKDDLSEIEKKLNFIYEDDSSNHKNDSSVDESENGVSNNIKKNNENIKAESTDNILQATNTLKSASLKMKNKIINDDTFFLPEKEENEKKDKKDTNRNIKPNFSIVESISQDEMTSKNEEEVKKI